MGAKAADLPVVQSTKFERLETYLAMGPYGRGDAIGARRLRRATPNIAPPFTVF
jgi:hypothetical protein